MNTLIGNDKKSHNLPAARIDFAPGIAKYTSCQREMPFALNRIGNIRQIRILTAKTLILKSLVRID